MFVLILWEDSKEKDVVSPEHVKKRKGKIVAKWGSGWFPAKIVKKSEDKNWLESLEVTTEGEIVTPEKRMSISSDLMAERRNHRQIIKERESQRQEVMADYNKELMKKSSIFNDDSEAEESDQASKYK
ncbi:uncharacterized protein LOC116417324 [Nasonia vitripennis]|uniref:Uncharacterized protein n=1 Tax=Nasonia vitripennis TaxID=7425 RepID=A0A7M7TA03_NASVI|nr:uncharacterized protein LOC116417324 [Nasonia vitripennis]